MGRWKVDFIEITLDIDSKLIRQVVCKCDNLNRESRSTVGHLTLVVIADHRRSTTSLNYPHIPSYQEIKVLNELNDLSFQILKGRKSQRFTSHCLNKNHPHLSPILRLQPLCSRFLNHVKHHPHIHPISCDHHGIDHPKIVVFATIQQSQ